MYIARTILQSADLNGYVGLEKNCIEQCSRMWLVMIISRKKLDTKQKLIVMICDIHLVTSSFLQHNLQLPGSCKSEHNFSNIRQDMRS